MSSRGEKTPLIVRKSDLILLGRAQRNGRARRVPVHIDTYELLRLKMIRETEWALTIGLSAPDRVRRIPAIEVGTGSFDPVFAERYWRERLELDGSPRSRKRRWWGLI